MRVHICFESEVNIGTGDTDIRYFVSADDDTLSWKSRSVIHRYDPTVEVEWYVAGLLVGASGMGAQKAVSDAKQMLKKAEKDGCVTRYVTPLPKEKKNER